MNTPKLLLSLLAVTAIAGGIAMGVVDDTPPAPPAPPAPTEPESESTPGLDRWTDHHQAGQQGEDRVYQRAIEQAASALDGQTIPELRARLRPHVETLEDEARWINFIVALMPTECVRNLPWPLVTTEIIRLQALVGMNLSNIQFGLAEGGNITRLRQAVVQVEKEIPVIRRERAALADRVIIELLGGSVGRSGVNVAEAILETLNAAE